MIFREGILKWLVFTVAVSLVPFGMVALSLWSGDKPLSLGALWPHGELLLVATALAADGVGDLIPTNPTASRAKIVAAGMCVIILVVAALWYALIQGHPEFKLSKISKGSMTIFASTVIACMCCKILAEKR